MVAQEETFESVTQEIISTNLDLRVVIQDIQNCNGPLEVLNDLNAVGREKIAKLRENIELLERITERQRDAKKKESYLAEIKNYRAQFTKMMIAFRRANVDSANAIEKLSREVLFNGSSEQHSILKKRRDAKSAMQASNKLTERLLYISKSLAETAQRSDIALDTLVTSSEKVFNTQKELKQQQQVILQSGRYLDKYGRRQITDKFVITGGFIFFLACVFYVLNKRSFF
ncbi:hypothetical protein TKK_0004915 [Trichogramma kaykai]|uniref:Sec20 C-terminal domain-containing protein n=1 Tax=Trichogramma kaykai TaxID=54128 RepID=A0ABD2XJV7_9HYME